MTVRQLIARLKRLPQSRDVVGGDLHAPIIDRATIWYDRWDNPRPIGEGHGEGPNQKTVVVIR